MSISVVIPVRDGARWLARLLDALAREAPDEVLVVDSGSRDDSVGIARAAGVRLVQIPPHEFGHGRTRNLAIAETSGDLIAFLTQDAVPVEGWLAGYAEAFARDDVGAAFGPHLPGPGTTPMVAREMREFWAARGLGDTPRLLRADERPFLSNANACYRRACVTAHPFPDLRYGEDNALARELARSPWRIAWHPGAGVWHAHDEGLATMFRRTFDDAALARRLDGWVDPFPGVSGLVRHVQEQVRADHGEPGTRSPLRSAAHHLTRRVAVLAGSRSDRLPPALARRLSLHEARVRGR